MGDESADPARSESFALERLTPEAESFAGFGRWAWTKATGFQLSDHLHAILAQHGLAPRSAREVLRTLLPVSRKVLVRVLRHAIRGEQVGTLSLSCRTATPPLIDTWMPSSWKTNVR